MIDAHFIIILLGLYFEIWFVACMNYKFDFLIIILLFSFVYLVILVSSILSIVIYFVLFCMIGNGCLLKMLILMLKLNGHLRMNKYIMLHDHVKKGDPQMSTFYKKV